MKLAINTSLYELMIRSSASAEVVSRFLAEVNASVRILIISCSGLFSHSSISSWDANDTFGGLFKALYLFVTQW